MMFKDDPSVPSALPKGSYYSIFISADSGHQPYVTEVSHSFHYFFCFGLEELPVLVGISEDLSRSNFNDNT